MPFIPIPNSATLCFDFTTQGQNWQFCVTVRKSAGSITPTDLDNIAGIGHSWWTNNLKAIGGNDNTLRQTRATDQQTQGGPQSIDTIGEVGTGGSNNATPMNAAHVMSLRTEKRGRSYRGRIFTGGWPAVTFANQVDWTGAASTARVNAFVALQVALDVAGFDLVVPSKQHNGVITNPAETNEVIAITADSHIDSMYKRLFGRGT
jgi:hypothetical protein